MARSVKPTRRTSFKESRHAQQNANPPVVDRSRHRVVGRRGRSLFTKRVENGATRELQIDDRDVLQEDRVFELDLPGGRRDLMRIDMACHAENGGQVRMMVMANR